MKTIILQTGWFYSSSSLEFIDKPDYWPLWLPLALMFSCLAVVFVRLIHPGYLQVLYESSWRNINIDLYVREDLSNSGLSGLLLHLNYIFITSTLFTVAFKDFISEHINGVNNPWLLLSIVMIFVAAHLCLRYILLLTTRSLTELENGLSESIYNFKVSTEVSSLFLTVLLILHFSLRLDNATIQILFIILMAILNIIYWFWSFQHSIKNGIGWFYLFLYLCTLEILPLVGVFYFFNE